MKKIVIISLLAVVVIGGLFFFLREPASEPNETENETIGSTKTAEGKVTNVNLDAVAFDGPAVVVIQTKGNERVRIAVPSMGIRLCEAYESIASPFDIEVGDYVFVRGEVSEENEVVPCISSEHYLRAESIVQDETLGYSFTYRKGPNGYIVVDTTESSSNTFVSGITLFDRAEYQELMNSTEPREGPPAIQVRVYKNTSTSVSPKAWVQNNTRESNYPLIVGTVEETTLDGKEAVRYTADGLYPNETYVVVEGQYVYVFSVMYPEVNSTIHLDFKALIETVSFTPSKG
ncbi:MAG: hypothetical protein WDZ88_03760 [Candidatus Paceibacterota bacterium]